MASRWLAVLAFPLALGCQPGRPRVAPPPQVLATGPAGGGSVQARAWYLEGQLRLADGDLDGADEALARALDLDPHSPWVLLAQAEVAMRGERYGDAASLWQQAVDRDPTCAPALQRLGWAHLVVGELDEAARWYDQAVEAGGGWRSRAGLVETLVAARRMDEAAEVLRAWPDPPAGRWSSGAELRRRGELAVSAGFYEQAWRDLAAYMDLEPEDVTALDLYLASAEPTQHYGRTLDHLDELGRRVPESSAIHRRTYTLARQVGDVPRSLEALERWHTVEPDYPGLDLDRARLLLALDRPAEAVEALAARSSRDAASALVRAKALAATGDVDGALAALAGLPDSRIDVLRERAWLLRKLGRFDEAGAMLDDAARDAPGSGALAVERARQAVGRGRLDEGRAILAAVPGLSAEDAALQWATLLWSDDRPEDALASLDGVVGPAISTLRARLLLALERPAQAVEELRQAPVDGGDVARGLLLGHALYGSGDVAGAMVAWRSVLERHPDSAEALNAVAYTLVETSGPGDDLAEAERMLRRARDLEPASAHIMDSLGWALYRSGRIEEAILELERANQYGSGEPTIAEHLRVARAALKAGR